MPEITYENVEPLIADLEVRGRSVAIQFECPASGQQVPARHSLAPKAQSRVTQTAKRTASYEARRAVSSMLRGVFGRGMMGRMASQAADSALQMAASGLTGSQQGLSKAEQREAVVEAFRSVASQFTWDASNARWIAARAARELMGPFELQLADAPLETNYDKQVLARMLVEVAQADGTLAPAEKDFMNEFLSPDVGSLDSLMERPPLTAAELANTSRGNVRGTLLMLTWVLALSDESFDPAEAERLKAFGQALGLTGAQATAMRQAAQAFLLDQAMERMVTWGGHDAHARKELYALADRLGMSRDEAEHAEAAWQRRRG
jgi:tellurite resistance protein